MAEYVIEDLTEEEEKKLEQRPDIEWYPDDILLSRDIVVSSKKDAIEVLKIIGRKK